MNIAYKQILFTVAAATLISTGCAKKKVAAVTPAPPSAVVAPAETPRPAPTPERTAPTPTPVAAAPASRFPDAATRARIDQLLAKIEDAYFDYNRASLRPDAMKALQGNATELRDILKDYPDYKLTIEGHADERGSAEYNLALGSKRAESAKEYLVQIGIPSDQLGLVSYGKERPVCEEQNEGCWQKNRRIHIVATAKAN